MAIVKYLGYCKVCFIFLHSSWPLMFLNSYKDSGFSLHPTKIAPCPDGDVTILPYWHLSRSSGPFGFKFTIMVSIQ